jgi:hypothetical protein
MNGKLTADKSYVLLILQYQISLVPNPIRNGTFIQVGPVAARLGSQSQGSPHQPLPCPSTHPNIGQSNSPSQALDHGFKSENRIAMYVRL